MTIQNYQTTLLTEINDVEGDRLKIDAHSDIKVHSIHHPSKHFIEQNLPTLKLMVSSLHAQIYLNNHFIVLICSSNSFFTNILVQFFQSLHLRNRQAYQFLKKHYQIISTPTKKQFSINLIQQLPISMVFPSAKLM